MSNGSIEGRLKGLQERFENEMRIRGEGAFHNQGGLGAPRPGSGRRPRPPMLPSREIPAYPPRSPQQTETEHQMREVYKVSGKLNVDGVEYRSSIDELQHLGELGSGTCGHVVKMLHKSSAAVIAVKQMRRSGNSEETKRILMDLDVVVRSHDCPYIVRCLGCFVTDADVWICMELMATCFDKLLKRLGAPMPEAILGKVTVATVNALSYLKDTHGVIHRDVKPSNILLDERGNVKLCDFGISGRLVDSKAKTRSAGCAAYMAPERIDPPDPTRPDYDIRADVWSLGISLVELATGVFPYRDCQNDFEVLTRVIADDPPQLPEDSGIEFSPEFKSFVTQCLTKNYRQRPKYAKLLEHPFVVKSARSSVSVGAWYASLPISGSSTPVKTSCVTTVATHSVNNGYEAPSTPQPVRNFVTSSQHWTPEQITPTPARSAAIQSNGYEAPSTPQPVRNFVTSSQHWTPEQITPTPARSGAMQSVSNGYEAPSTPQPVRNFVTSSQHWTPEKITPTPARSAAIQSNGYEAPSTPQPVRNFVTSSQHWTPEQITPTPARSVAMQSVSNGYEAPSTPQPVRNFVTSSQHWTPEKITPTPARSVAMQSVSNGYEAPSTPQPVRNFVTSSQHWTPEQITPTPARAWWASTCSNNAGGSSSQPASLETDFSNHSPYPRRRTIDACASPPPPPVRRVSTENRWRASPASSGNTSPIVLQRFQHQSQQRRSRVDLHSTPRHRSLSKEHSAGRSPEPPPRTSRQHAMLGHEANGSVELEPPSLHERLHPPSPLLLNERLSEGRSQSLTRAELRNGYRAAAELAAPAQPKHHHDDQGWLHSLAGLVKRRLSGYVKWHHVAARDRERDPRQPHPHPHPARHRWNSSESWSVPASPLPPRAPPPRPSD